MCLHGCGYPQRPRLSEPLGLESQTVVRCKTSVLGIELDPQGEHELDPLGEHGC